MFLPGLQRGLTGLARASDATRVLAVRETLTEEAHEPPAVPFRQGPPGAVRRLVAVSGGQREKVHDNDVGLAISSEDGPLTRGLRIHHNLIFDNRASGLYFSRWGKDNPRQDVVVTNNTLRSNRHHERSKDGRSEPVIKERRRDGRRRAFLVTLSSVAMSSSRLSGRPFAKAALQWPQTRSSGLRSGA